MLTERAYGRLLDTFFAMVYPAHGERCIDLGCGTGAFTRRLRRFDLQLARMDISPGAIAYAKGIDPSIDFLVGDIGATDLADGSQDIIVYSGALHHVAIHDRHCSQPKERPRTRYCYDALSCGRSCCRRGIASRN